MARSNLYLLLTQRVIISGSKRLAEHLAVPDFKESANSWTGIGTTGFARWTSTGASTALNKCSVRIKWTRAASLRTVAQSFSRQQRRSGRISEREIGIMDVAEAVATRRSIRAFLERPVPVDILHRVMDQARMAPSGCNFQPWEAKILTGAPLSNLQMHLLRSAPDDPPEYDFSAPGRIEKYQSRLRAVGRAMYNAMGIERENADQRDAFRRLNMVSFGAPVLLLCHFPKFMKEAQWSDVGMWLQTIMLLLRGEGLDSCPQEYMGVYGRTIKEHLGLPADTLLFCGIAIGWRDANQAVNSFERERTPLTEQVSFIGFD